MAAPPPTLAHREREAVDGSAPALYIYNSNHPIRGVPPLGNLNDGDLTKLILFNIQGFTVKQIWTELHASLGDLGRAIVKVERVAGLNRNPHGVLWVRKDLGASLLSLVRSQTKQRSWRYLRWVTEAQRRANATFNTTDRPGDELRFAAVTHWRLALWQPWRDRRNDSPRYQPALETVRNNTSVSTWNINGFWSKHMEVEDFVSKENVAILGLQETLAKGNHYTPRLTGYKAYCSAAQEDFRGIATFVETRLASYEVPHGLRWLVHVKVFGYQGWTGPTHFLNVYMKSGGRHRKTRRADMAIVKEIVKKIIDNSNDGARVVVMGDYNEESSTVMKRLDVGGSAPLAPVHFVGSDTTRFPERGAKKRPLDFFLLSEEAFRFFRSARVLRQYNSSDHRPVLLRPQRLVPPTREEKTRTSFDTKALRLKGDLVINDNAWTKLMTDAYGPDHEHGADDDTEAEVSEAADRFIETFDEVCRKHNVKKVHEVGSGPRFPKKLRTLLQTVKRISKEYNNCSGTGRIPEEITVVRLARAQKRFKEAKKKWLIQMKQRFYSRVVDDFVANDHKNVWSRLNSQLKPMDLGKSVHPVKDKDGHLKHRAEEILAVMKEHYEDLLTYDPKNLSLDHEHWESVDLGDPMPSLGLSETPYWPEVLVTIRGMNRNTAPGKDGIHINVLKTLVLEECMAEVKENAKKKNRPWKRPDNVRIDLPKDRLPHHPLTPLGKAFFSLLLRTWNTSCIPSQWNDVQIVNLPKGGDLENANNYRGISLMSCAFKVLMALMANRVSEATDEAGIIPREQAGFRRREEAVAQSIALAEIVRRRYLEGKPTFGVFIDFKKAYDRLYHGWLFRLLDHVGIRGKFLDLVKAMYGGTQYSVRVAGHLSESFSPIRGAKQGDPLSPIFYVLSIKDILKFASIKGGVRVRGVPYERCPGLKYADDVVALENTTEDVHETLHGIWKWGQTYGMDLGHEKCGVIMWASDRERKTRRRINPLFEIGDEGESVASSVEGNGDWEILDMDEREFIHAHTRYDTPDGVIPTVTQYKYLGITIDTRLGHSRKVIRGERSMELEFAHLQAKKGLKVLHSLRPFLTDRHCPIVLKVQLVRNLVYSKMLYGGELIGFQMLHAEPLQRVINLAAKWIIGVSKDNTQFDAFTLCYELSLPPIHQELSAMRARLTEKLRYHNRMQTWLKHLWDNPPDFSSLHLTWVTNSKKWMRMIDKEANKYKTIDGYEQIPLANRRTQPHATAPLRPWAQLGKSIEMEVRSNPYVSETWLAIKEAFTGERITGGPVEILEGDIPEGYNAEDLVIRPIHGQIDAPWDYSLERQWMDEGRTVPRTRTRWEVVKTNLVRDVILERMMAANRSKSFKFFDIFALGVTRGYIREAANRPDLAEGVRWLSLARCRGFPTVEGAWQRIKRSGREPGFDRGKCPLCGSAADHGWEFAHLLIQCTHSEVRQARTKHLYQSILHIRQNIQGREAREQIFDGFRTEMGREQIPLGGVTPYNAVTSIYLRGGSYRHYDLTGEEGWFDTYQLGFGALKLITPGFESYGYCYVASFLQKVAPLFVSRLGGALYGDVASNAETQSEGSQDELENHRYRHAEELRDSPEPLDPDEASD